MGESECVASLKVLIQHTAIMMTDAVQIATSIDRSEQQEKFDHLFPTRTNANATVDEQ